MLRVIIAAPFALAALPLFFAAGLLVGLGAILWMVAKHIAPHVFNFEGSEEDASQETR